MDGRVVMTRSGRCVFELTTSETDAPESVRDLMAKGLLTRAWLRILESAAAAGFVVNTTTEVDD